jgi:hypothetical protein
MNAVLFQMLQTPRQIMKASQPHACCISSGIVCASSTGTSHEPWGNFSSNGTLQQRTTSSAVRVKAGVGKARIRSD